MICYDDILLAANPATCTRTTTLSYWSFPTFLTLFHHFQHYLACCHLVIQVAIAAAMLFSTSLTWGQPGLRRNHDKPCFVFFLMFWLLIHTRTHTHKHTHTQTHPWAWPPYPWKPPTKLQQCFSSSIFILKDCFDRLWNNWHAEKTRRQWHFLQLHQRYPKADEQIPR